MPISSYSCIIILLQTPLGMSFLGFSEDSENTNFSTFLSSLPLTEVHGRVSSNGRNKRGKEGEKHTHINQQFSFMNRKIGRFPISI